MLERFINSLRLFFGMSSLIELSASEYQSFYKDIMALNEYANLKNVRKVMLKTKLDNKKIKTQVAPDKLSVGQVYLLNDNFVQAFILILDISEDNKYTTNCLCLPGKLPNGKSVMTSLGIFTVFPSLQIYQAPEQVSRLSYVFNIDEINGVKTWQFSFVNDLDILKKEKLAPPSVLNELDIKITHKNFQKIFCDYYFYIQEIYSASWNYLLDGDKNHDKYI